MINKKKLQLAGVLRKLGDDSNAESRILFSSLEKIERDLAGVRENTPDISPLGEQIEELRENHKSFSLAISSLSGIISARYESLLKRLDSNNQVSQEQIRSFIELNQKDINSLKKRIEEAESLVVRNSQWGGGAPHRRIQINSSVLSTKYTDVNYLGSITKADNDITKQVDITFSGSGGGGGWETPVGTINGTNKIFTVANEPQILFVDGNPTAFEETYTYSGGTITFLIAPQRWLLSGF